MATRSQIEETYNYMDELWRASFGEHPDLTCALFDGDFSQTLEEAQRAKHRMILDGLGVRAGSRVLDVGCGWGPLLAAIRERGAHGVGITLSTRQWQACRRGGLDAHLMDWRDVTPDTFGGFDAVAGVGCMEHFCTPEDYEAGRQDEVYRRFFAWCHALLPPGGRLYVQSMVWGPGYPGYARISLDAPKGSKAWLTAMLGEFYPGSFGAFGADHYVRCAAGWFKETYRSDGRLDYIETLDRWSAWHDWTPRKLWLAAKLVVPWLRDPAFRRKVEALRASNNKECFRREILTLCRLLFEKI
jgi:cyclopropane-fatty-acyl-phospholipid synthase